MPVNVCSRSRNLYRRGSTLVYVLFVSLSLGVATAGFVSNSGNQVLASSARQARVKLQRQADAVMEVAKARLDAILKDGDGNWDEILDVKGGVYYKEIKDASGRVMMTISATLKDLPTENYDPHGGGGSGETAGIFGGRGKENAAMLEITVNIGGTYNEQTGEFEGGETVTVNKKVSHVSSFYGVPVRGRVVVVLNNSNSMLEKVRIVDTTKNSYEFTDFKGRTWPSTKGDRTTWPTKMTVMRSNGYWLTQSMLFEGSQVKAITYVSHGGGDGSGANAGSAIYIGQNNEPQWPGYRILAKRGEEPRVRGVVRFTGDNLFTPTEANVQDGLTIFEDFEDPYGKEQTFGGTPLMGALYRTTHNFGRDIDQIFIVSDGETFDGSILDRFPVWLKGGYAQTMQSTVWANHAGLKPECEVYVIYVGKMAGSNNAPRRHMLDLLQVPATYGNQYVYKPGTTTKVYGLHKNDIEGFDYKGIVGKLGTYILGQDDGDDGGIDN